MRSTFTEEDYLKYQKSFWALPNSWGKRNGSLLAKIWKEGGVGAVSAVPILGLYAHSHKADEWVLSKEELARLAGVHTNSVRKGADALSRLELAKSSLTLRFGKWATTWNLSPSLAAPKSGQGFDPDYFYFPARFIFGGNWSRLTGTQRAVLLAVATQCRHYEQPLYDHRFLKGALAPQASRADLKACLDLSQSSNHPGLRLACVSYTELEALTGICRPSLFRAVTRLKHPESWKQCKNDPERLKYSPLAVYPSSGGALVYHVRDHVPHWPFGVLNSEETPEEACHTKQIPLLPEGT